MLAGDFDLRVPALVAVIDSIKKLSLGDVVVDLVVSCRTCCLEPCRAVRHRVRHELLLLLHVYCDIIDAVEI